MINDKYLHRSMRDMESIAAVLTAGQLSGTASVVKDYECALAAYFHVPFAVAVSSGSAALSAALHVMNVGPGHEVLIPATSPLPSVFPISAAGAMPVPVDVRDHTLDFDPEDLSRKMSSRTKAAILVPMWGYPIDITETLSILGAAKIPLIEDAAHAHGAKVGSDFVGTQGEVGCFSTHDRKLLSTGEGGFVLTKRAEVAEAIRSYATLGMLAGVRSGVNYKLNAIAAALGQVRLQELDEQISKRHANASLIRERLPSLSCYAELAYPANSLPNFYNLVLMLNEKSPGRRQKMLSQLDTLGLHIDQIKYGYNVFYKREVYRHIRAACPNAEEMVSAVIQIPVHPGLQRADLEQISKVLLEVNANASVRKQALHGLRPDRA